MNKPAKTKKQTNGLLAGVKSLIFYLGVVFFFPGRTGLERLWGEILFFFANRSRTVALQ